MPTPAPQPVLARHHCKGRFAIRNIIDSRATTQNDFLGTPFGFTFGLSSSDDLSTVLFGFDTATVNEAATDTTQVSLFKVSGLGTHRLTVSGSFPALPADPGELVAWRGLVDVTPITIARLSGPDGMDLAITFAAPVPVDIFGRSITDFLSGDDKVIGTKWRDFIGGKAGDDLLLGRGGDDSLDGGAGEDVLKGGSGHDSLTGADGDDRLIGGGGDDRLLSGYGDDVLLGGGGNDFLFAEWGDAGEIKSLNGGKGNDVIELALDTVIESAAAGNSPVTRGHSPAPTESPDLNIGVSGGDGDGDTVLMRSDRLAVDGDEEDASLHFSEGGVTWDRSVTRPQTLSESVWQTGIDLKGIEKVEMSISGLDGLVTDFGGVKGAMTVRFESLEKSEPGFRLVAETDTTIYDISNIQPRVSFSYELRAAVGNSSQTVQAIGLPRFADDVVIDLRGGADTVIGSFHNSVILLGNGDDVAKCGAGRQTVVDGKGGDQVRGGAGNDTFAFVADGARDRILDWTPGDVIAIEGLEGGNFDLLTGKKIAPDRFVLEFGGDKLDVKVKAPGATLDDMLHIDTFDFDFFPIPLT